ncbi:hypothetical protein MMC21_001633 [Puttea exsequens]|nr:hypothetical protein [Puttea exsequens]
MATLLTGGTGKTSVRLASMLQNANIPFVLASRKATDSAPSGMPAVKFDWLDASTYDNPFVYDFPSGRKVSAIYLVAPEVDDPAPAMNALINHAAEKHGVKRFVFLTGSSVEPGGFYTGPVWQHLIDLKAEYCVLRATWFMENILGLYLLKTLKDESKIYSACEDAKIPWVSAEDIAAVAFKALTSPKPLDLPDYRVLGPELLSYDGIAAKLSAGLGRKIEHVKLSQEESAKRYQGLGLSDRMAGVMASLEVHTANGGEERMNDAVEKVTGRSPIRFDDFVKQNEEALL